MLVQTLDKLKIKDFHVFEFIDRFRAACYPAFPVTAERTEDSIKNQNLFYQRVVDHWSKLDVAWLTTLFLLDPLFTSQPVTDIDQVRSDLCSHRLAVPFAMIAELMASREKYPFVLTGARMKQGQRIMFRGPIHERTQTELGFPRPEGYYMPENDVWAPFDAVVSCRFNSDAIDLTLKPDYKIPPLHPRTKAPLTGTQFKREISLKACNIETVELTGFKTLFEPCFSYILPDGDFH